MFRPSTIIKELVLSLASVILKHSVKLYFIGHNFTECFNITLARLSTSSLMMVEDRNM
jgi:hypothetical protein